MLSCFGQIYFIILLDRTERETVNMSLRNKEGKKGADKQHIERKKGKTGEEENKKFLNAQD